MKKKKIVPRRRNQFINKKCFFCEEKKEPQFSDVEILRRYLSDRGKIMPRARSGNCAKHQRRLTLSVKYARNLALLSYAGQR